MVVIPKKVSQTNLYNKAPLVKKVVARKIPKPKKFQPKVIQPKSEPTNYKKVEINQDYGLTL